MLYSFFFFFLMIRRPPRSTQGVSSAASDVYKRQELVVRPTEFNAEFILKLIPKLNWELLLETVKLLPTKVELPPEMTTETEKDEALLKLLHTILMKTHVMEGELICSHCQKTFNINKGIPNLLNQFSVF
eukprot:TRINITY_DN10084_c0_g1_i6.p1 TRINITY_DN10084_c0_g1~~TRINITY_DN10084_c0_g1_i6.p1  ORF type:complete len:130 (-),score=32.87 TRINITY_DN10084_c0_g1_i6:38-427(-)